MSLERPTQQEYELRFAELCQGFQENRPDMTEPFMYFQEDESPIDDARAIRLGQALRGNTFVTKLTVQVGAMTLAGTVGVAQFIAVSPSLNELRLTTSALRGDVRRRNRQTAVVDRLLTAAAFHGRITKLDVPEFFGAFALANCLQANRKTMVNLELNFYGGEPNAAITQEMLDDAETVAASVGSLTVLETLDLYYTNDQCFVSPILNHMVDHPILRELVLDQSGSSTTARVAPASGLRNLLMSSTPLQELGYYDMERDTPNEAEHADLLSSLRGHATLRTLHFLSSCRTGSEETTVVSLIAEMLCHNESIIELCFHCSNLVAFSKIVEALGDNSTLETIADVYMDGMDEAEFQEGSRRLATFLPRVQYLQTLEFHCEGPVAGTPVDDFLRAFELNTSLKEIHLDGFSNHDDVHAKLAYYTTRNKFAPLLANASVAEIPGIVAAALANEHGAAVVHDALRRRDDLFDGLVS